MFKEHIERGIEQFLASPRGFFAARSAWTASAFAAGWRWLAGEQGGSIAHSRILTSLYCVSISGSGIGICK